MSTTELTPDALAWKCAEAMLERDQASQALGIALDAAGPGWARASMTIRETMVNGHNIAHGGVTYTLADSTFAFACNSRDEPNVALQCSISYLSAVKLGDHLVAEAQERSSKGRTGVYDITVTRNGEAVALFRGVCYRIKGTVLGGATT
ncbi:MAG TPA: hydroxyphenylacetyl-CoA thioesterase PaaI [Candidatus Baltobacteraceae bacterium]|nr:hydroxyphenylacetyl-CoA thioesterase PaaI [Candidatus Baltobacteraceae bacterium]